MKKMIPNSTAADQTVPARTIFDENNGRGLPKRTFKDKMTLFEGNDEVAASWKIPAKYTGYAPADPGRLKNNVALVYKEFDAK